MPNRKSNSHPDKAESDEAVDLQCFMEVKASHKELDGGVHIH